MGQTKNTVNAALVKAIKLMHDAKFFATFCSWDLKKFSLYLSKDENYIIIVINDEVKGFVPYDFVKGAFRDMTSVIEVKMLLIEKQYEN